MPSRIGTGTSSSRVTETSAFESFAFAPGALCTDPGPLAAETVELEAKSATAVISSRKSDNMRLWPVKVALLGLDPRHL